MSKLISLDDAIAAVNSSNMLSDFEKAMFRVVLMKVPAADAVPVASGQWLCVPGTDEVECSYCGFRWWDGCQECGVGPSNVDRCPICGAKNEY